MLNDFPEDTFDGSTGASVPVTLKEHNGICTGDTEVYLGLSVTDLWQLFEDDLLFKSMWLILCRVWSPNRFEALMVAILLDSMHSEESGCDFCE